ncbi:hypothetical protein CDAR_580721 [Caerostris darwini]|uniref:Uncharacterized protein n=1 Tax=Caerostris darwini TaxID=1538125 RepID=A0AAV4TTU5_9ARAC|nr:hypothetical protein CDAR_580721 [Caerostris darwini]
MPALLPQQIHLQQTHIWSLTEIPLPSKRGELFSNSQHLNKLQRPLKIRGGNELYVEVQGRRKISPPESEDLENKSLPFDARGSGWTRFAEETNFMLRLKADRRFLPQNQKNWRTNLFPLMQGGVGGREVAAGVELAESFLDLLRGGGSE